MSKYMTKQRRLLLDYLTEHSHESMNARQITDALKETEINFSTVYRNLVELENDGFIKRIMSSGREAYFQYIDSPECNNCLHLYCKQCGNSFHMDESEEQSLLKVLEKNDGFSLDTKETVLYGICKKCKGINKKCTGSI